MSLRPKEELFSELDTTLKPSKNKEGIFSKDYVEVLREAGWRLEKKLPSNRNNYSDLLADTDWNTNDINLICSKHYRRDLDALS